MARISSYILILAVYFLHRNEPVEGAEREVLVRDRLVFLLCDQMKSYMNDGKLPEPIKIMPQKYKNIHPGKGGRGRSRRSFPVNVGKFSTDDSEENPYRGKRGVDVPVLDLNDEKFW